MTLLAIVPKTAPVNIIMSMTGNAIAWELRRIACFCMAGRADQALVLPCQGKARRNIMIEIPDLPAIDGVAARAV